MSIETNIVELSKRKSERLSKDQMKALKALCKSYSSRLECAQFIGINRQVLDRVLLTSSGSPITVTKIKLSIGEDS